MTATPDTVTRWQPIETAPPKPMAVLFYYAKAYCFYEDANAPLAWDWTAPENVAILADVGYWTGAQWREAGTNHDVFEFDAKIGDANKPTHWQPIEPPR